jgi:hypothetical protein
MREQLRDEALLDAELEELLLDVLHDLADGGGEVEEVELLMKFLGGGVEQLVSKSDRLGAPHERGDLVGQMRVTFAQLGER